MKKSLCSVVHTFVGKHTYCIKTKKFTLQNTENKNRLIY